MHVKHCNKPSHVSNFSLVRVRFLLGGRHGDFKFLPPSSYAPCYEALLPKEKMKVEPVKEYKRDVDGVRDLLGTTQFMSQASFIPTPVETSQVSSQEACRMVIMRKTPPFSQRLWCSVTCKRMQINWKNAHLEFDAILVYLFNFSKRIALLCFNYWVFCILQFARLFGKCSFAYLFLQIVMPPHLEKVRDKLAENIHELWGMNKIELGWSYGKVRVRLLMRLLFSCLCCSPTSSSLGSKDKKHTPCRFPCLWRNKHDNYNFFSMSVTTYHHRGLCVILLSLL